MKAGRADDLPASLSHALPYCHSCAMVRCHPLHLTVPLRAVGPRVYVPGPGGLQQRAKLATAVGRAVVGHHALDGQTQPRVEAQRAAHERRAGALPLVGQQLRVSYAAEVVHGGVQAGVAVARVRVRDDGLPTGPPAPAVRDPRDLLDVHVDQLPGPLAPVTHGGTEPRRRTSPVTRPTSASLGIPRPATILAQVRAGTPVAAARPSGASMSSRLAAATRSSTSGGVSLASLRGRLLRSASPSPDLPQRSHLPATWQQTPICRAASATPRPDSMRETKVSRPSG